jgi:SAM-dependent methyltransferase
MNGLPQGSGLVDVNVDASLPRRRHRPLRALLLLINRAAPGLRPLIFRVIAAGGYDLITHYAPESMTFINYGYAAVGDQTETLTLQPQDEPNRLAIQLYDVTLSGADLTDKDVLEVGCGRGGGSDFIARYRSPRRMIGVDLAGRAIAFCRRHYHVDRLSFQAGNAEQLPFPDSSYDVVVNVESSHVYPSVDTFLSEVHRVLHREGKLFLADFRPRDGVETLRQQFCDAGFTIQEDERINDNVLGALDLLSEPRQAIIQRNFPRPIQRLLSLNEVAAVKDSDVYRLIASEDIEYRRFVLVKTAEPS